MKAPVVAKLNESSLKIDIRRSSCVEGNGDGNINSNIQAEQAAAAASVRRRRASRLTHLSSLPRWFSCRRSLRTARNRRRRTWACSSS